MSVVITRGYGSGASIALVITRGYGAAVAPSTGGGGRRRRIIWRPPFGAPSGIFPATVVSGPAWGQGGSTARAGGLVIVLSSAATAEGTSSATAGPGLLIQMLGSATARGLSSMAASGTAAPAAVWEELDELNDVEELRLLGVLD